MWGMWRQIAVREMPSGGHKDIFGFHGAVEVARSMDVMQKPWTV